MVRLLLVAILAQTAQSPALPKICIEKIRGEAGLGSAAEDALSASLLSTKRIRIIEGCEKADFIVKGSIVERADLKSRSESEEAGVSSGSVVASGSRVSGSAGGARGSESISNTEIKRSVTLSVKFVKQDGEVVFAATQDSSSSKSKSAIGEATEKISREVIRELFPASPTDADKRNQTGYKRIR